MKKASLNEIFSHDCRVRVRVMPDGPTKEGFPWWRNLNLIGLANSRDEFKKTPTLFGMPGRVLQAESGQWFEYEIIGE